MGGTAKNDPAKKAQPESKRPEEPAGAAASRQAAESEGIGRPWKLLRRLFWAEDGHG